jgi:hypothetical protein
MSYLTPPADFDGITAGLKLIEQAVDNIAFAKAKPHRQRESLQEAANRLHDAWMAVQTMAGRALREEEEQKRRGGFEECLLCHHWKPLELLVRENAGYGGEDEERQNHWFHCVSCAEFWERHPQPPSPDRDPFDEEEEAG